MKFTTCCTASAVAYADPSTICAGDSIYIVASSGVTYLWSTGNTSQTIIAAPAVTANYWVSVADTSGCSANAVITITVDTTCIPPPPPTGIFQLNAASLQINVYPNPSCGVFMLDAGRQTTDAKQLIIYNVYGESVYLASAIGHQLSVIDLSFQPIGIYFLKIKTDKEFFIQKLIIQK